MPKTRIRSIFICLLGALTTLSSSSVSVQANDEGSDQNVLSVDNAESLAIAISEVARRRESGNSEKLTIEFTQGIYQLSEPILLTPELIGNGLTLSADPKKPAIVSGGRRLKQVSQTGDELRYQIPDGWRAKGIPRCLFVDGRWSAPARHPNQGYHRIVAAAEDRRTGVFVDPANLPASWKPTKQDTSFKGDMVLLHDWSSSRLPIESLDSSNGQLQMIGPMGAAADHYAIDHFEKQPRYFLEGHPAFADQPGEWYVDEKSDQVVFKVDSNFIPNEVIFPWLDQLVVATGSNEELARHLVIRGLQFCHTRFPCPPGGYAGVQAAAIESRNADGSRTSSLRKHIGGAVVLEHAGNCQILNCRFHNLGNTGLWVGKGTKNCRIFRCRFHDLGGNGINLGDTSQSDTASGLLVTECGVSDVGRILPGAVGIWAGIVQGVSILNNHVHDCPYTGISIGWKWDDSETPAGDNRVVDNRIEFVMQTLSDGGGIYTLGRQPGSVLGGNQISDVPLNAGRAESNGIFMDQGSSGFTVENNVIRRIDRSPIRFHQCRENLVRNNRWEVASDSTPALKFNNTKPENITSSENEIIPTQKSIYLIGNSLTWDTVPTRLDERVHFHVDCGKNLLYIRDNPKSPCVDASRLWPKALRTAQYDWVSVQPHYGTSIDENVEVIAGWVAMQDKAVFVIHTGWARHETLIVESKNSDLTGLMVHSIAHYEELLSRLRKRFPDREFKRTKAVDHLMEIQADIESGTAPFESIDQIYRDVIHMKINEGRYLMHNAMRAALGQARSNTGHEQMDPKMQAYLNQVLDGA